jgi:adenylate cyclase class IV
VPRNIELKVACTSGQLADITRRMNERQLSAIHHLGQIDTYFRVPHGRLKLREIDASGERSAELIQYHRPDDPGARTSTYRRIPVAVDQTASLTAALCDALGELATVRKRRAVAIWRSTRIHLDQVDGLGQFVELETVLGMDPDSAEVGRIEFDDVVEWLGLASLEAIPGSYSDLLIAKGQTA